MNIVERDYIIWCLTSVFVLVHPFVSTGNLLRTTDGEVLFKF